jgi:glycerol-3-phosphate acyltransferase PlsY
VSWWWLLVAGAYLMGSAPNARAIGALAGHDPTVEGSGNPGASNVYRVAGRRAGVAVLLLDVLKGLVPSLAGMGVGGRGLSLACGVAAVVGHVFPLGRLRRGGKGVATTGGMALALYPLVFGALALIWLVVMRVARTASVGSLVLATLLPIGVAVSGRPWWEIAAVGATCLLVVLRHRANIGRLLRRQERRLRSRDRVP